MEEHATLPVNAPHAMQKVQRDQGLMGQFAKALPPSGAWTPPWFASLYFLYFYFSIMILFLLYGFALINFFLQNIKTSLKNQKKDKI